MQEKARNEKWVRCPYCRHKLFKEVADEGSILIETKCGSCKRVFMLRLGKGLDEKQA